MDFGTMGKRIENGSYTTLQDYEKDFRLVCTNCKKYNPKQTIFHKVACPAADLP